MKPSRKICFFSNFLTYDLVLFSPHLKASSSSLAWSKENKYFKTWLQIFIQLSAYGTLGKS